MVTMLDVARRAGVSQSTVSHLLNGTRRVSPDTERAIRTAIADLGYVHDALARSLRTGRTQTIGLAISAISNPYFAELVRDVERRIAAAGRTMLLVDTGDDPARELGAVRQLLRHRPDGVMLAPATDTPEALRVLADMEVPTVVVDRVLPELPDRVDAVGVENRGPMRDLAALLGGLGHRSIGLLAGLPSLLTTRERVEGYRDGIATIEDAAPPLVEYAGRSDPDTEGAIDALFDATPAPTAVVGGNNQATIALMRWLRRHGRSVPDDVSIAGFDDFEWTDLFHPRLTTIRQPIDALAETAAGLLADRLADPSRAARVVRLPPDLVVRDSIRRIA